MFGKNYFLVVLDDGLRANKRPIAGVIQQKALTRPIEELALAHVSYVQPFEQKHHVAEVLLHHTRAASLHHDLIVQRLGIEPETDSWKE